jgi:hypothetical protein
MLILPGDLWSYNMITQPAFFLPQNDEELNNYIASINQMYTDNFSFNLGSKKSEKLRDAVCAHLGFPNGYQQIKAHWNNNQHFDFFARNKENSTFLFAPCFGDIPVAIIPSCISEWLRAALSEEFPNTKDGFCDGEQEVSDSSWRTSYLFGEQPPHALFTKQRDQWIPLYVNTLIVGYVNISQNKNYAFLMQGIINCLYLETPADLLHAIDPQNGSEWASVAAHHNIPEIADFSQVVSLRMSSADSSIIIPFSGEAKLNNNELSFLAGVRTTSGTPKKRNCVIKKGPNDTFLLGDLSFDFVVLYDFNQEPEGFTLYGHKGFYLDSLEWLGKDGVLARIDEGYEIHDYHNNRLTCTPNEPKNKGHRGLFSNSNIYSRK